MTIREYIQADIPAMRALWRRVFDESECFLDAFFRLLPDIGSAVVATGEGHELLGAAYALTGFEWQRTDGTRAQIGYLYAVAVEEDARGQGIGAALSGAAAELCRKRESQIVATLPANAPLYDWYEKTVGTRHLLFRERHTVPARKSVDIMKLTATEYMLWRENLLRGKNFVRPSYPMLETQRALCEAYGGGGGFTLVSFFGKANYNFADRYLASVTVRYDGSSRFGRNNRFGLFPSVSLGWRIDKEPFMEDATWLENLKIRASWGQTGNQEIANVARYTLYESNYGEAGFGGQSYGTSYDIEGTNGGKTLPSGFKRQRFQAQPAWQ